jgi:hypothetical protein
VLPPRAPELSEGAPADDVEPPSPRTPLPRSAPASMVSLNAPRSYLSDDGIVHLFSALLMHGAFDSMCHA